MPCVTFLVGWFADVYLFWRKGKGTWTWRDRDRGTGKSPTTPTPTIPCQPAMPLLPLYLPPSPLCPLVTPLPPCYLILILTLSFGSLEEKREGGEGDFGEDGGGGTGHAGAGRRMGREGGGLSRTCDFSPVPHYPPAASTHHTCHALFAALLHAHLFAFCTPGPSLPTPTPYPCLDLILTHNTFSLEPQWAGMYIIVHYLSVFFREEDMACLLTLAPFHGLLIFACEKWHGQDGWMGQDDDGVDFLPSPYHHTHHTPPHTLKIHFR